MAAVALVAMTAACGPKQQMPVQPTPTVKVMEARTSAVPSSIELPGRIEAVRTAEVRARVDGIIERRLYEEGSDVRAGTPLFQIDPRDLRAQVAQAKASLSRANAARINAAAVVRRYEPLVARKAISAQEYDAARTQLADAEGAVMEAKAQLIRAEIQLGYTTVRAPISGRVGRALVTEGALASAAQATELTTVNQLAPVYATFTESSAGLTQLLAKTRSGEIDASNRSNIKVTLMTESGTEYPQTGKLDFADLSVDPSTGSQTLRAIFPNPDRRLLPGQFIRARVMVGTVPDAIVVPSRAVQIKGEKASLLVIGQNGQPAPREVKVGEQQANGWVIESGLKPGERYVVDGWQKVQPGKKVNVKLVSPNEAGAPAGAPAR